MEHDTCAEDECYAAVHAKGRCKRHYDAWYRAQNPEKVKRDRDAKRAKAAEYNASRRKPKLPPRTCVVCDRSFVPNAKSQTTCPPSEDERSGGKIESWCHARLYRYKSGERLELKGTPPPFDGKKYVRKFVCANCGAAAVAGENGTHIMASRFCTRKCKAEWHRPSVKAWPTCRIKKRVVRVWIEGRCPECGERFTRKRKAGNVVGFCTRKCQAKAKRRRHEAFKRGAGRKTLTFWKVADRDNLTCQLCGEPVSLTEQAPHPLSPSLDHIVPLSRGGSHSYDNVQLAHFLCNSRKGNGSAVPIGGQLSMV